jgi:hypothetical protein
LILIVFVSSGLLLTKSAEAETDGYGSVGVKAGDWAKYKVTCAGSSNVWEDDMSWTKTEVVNASGSRVSVIETFHYPDDREITRDSGYDLFYGRKKHGCLRNSASTQKLQRYMIGQ